MDRFPLFRLPAVALAEVMKMFHLFDLTMLKMCSKRTHKWIKAFRVHRNDLTIEVVHDYWIRVQIYNRPKNEYTVYQITDYTTKMNRSIKIGDLVIPMTFEIIDDSEYHMNLYFEDKIEGLKAVTEYFCSLFQQEIYDVRVSSALNLNGPVTVMEWILKRQKRFHFYMIGSENMSETVAADLLSKINNAEEVSIEFEFGANFKPSFTFEGDCLEMQDSPWFTLNNLFSMNCSYLFVGETKLTNMDMNAFLKHWISNDLKFKEIIIGMEAIRLDVLFSGIPGIQRTNNVERVYKNSDNRSLYMNGGFDIKRYDGVTATLVHNGGFGVSEFWMIVLDN
uniref:FBA_2 domain-containing protein n=1 Tax=Caenorhabditis tropicalis TaxID=1561998 RepID=A0A1I7TWV4_9PELO